MSLLLEAHVCAARPVAAAAAAAVGIGDAISDGVNGRPLAGVGESLDGG